MRTYLYILVLAVVFWSCESKGPGSVMNELPTTPTQVFPSDNLLCTDNAVAFEWDAATDPEGFPVKYRLQVATVRNFTEIEHDIKKIAGTSQTITLERGVAYYWRVVAVDAELKEGEFSETYQFYTEGDGVSNYAPFLPILVAPSIDAKLTEASALLEWIGTDVDYDTLIYDVYFGTDNPPTTQVGSDLEAANFSVDLNAATDYYWRVIVNDQNGSKVWGQVWNFSTD